jgi:hypothetical protein
MIPNIRIHESLLRERQEALRREVDQQRLLSDLPHRKGLGHLLRRMGSWFVALGTRRQQREQPAQATGASGRKTTQLVGRTGA